MKDIISAQCAVWVSKDGPLYENPLQDVEIIRSNNYFSACRSFYNARFNESIQKSLNFVK